MTFIMSCLPIAALFILWDIQFTRQGVWGFNPEHHSAIILMGMPIEEYLFFLVIPFCCTFTYEVLEIVGLRTHSSMQTLHRAIGVSAVIIAAATISSTYTSTVFLAVAAVCLVTWNEPNWLGRAYLSYAVLMIPFVAVNGLLTGTLIVDEVVWYNRQAIIGWRVGTIPVEDFAYCFAMFVSQIACYEQLKAQSKEKKWKQTYFQLSK